MSARESCAECGVRKAIRLSLFCGQCHAALVASAEAYGPLVTGEDTPRPPNDDPAQVGLFGEAA